MDLINKRVLEEAKYLIETNDTIRQTAKQFNVSKSTVHKDFQDRLSNIDNDLYLKVAKILDYHTKVRHIRGGESTKQKYLKSK